MTFTVDNSWAASGAIASANMILFMPLLYYLFVAAGVEYKKFGLRVLFGLFLVTVACFFVDFGILRIDWSCQV